MQSTSHQPMRRTKHLVEAVAGKVRTIRFDVPARTNERRQHIAEQIGGIR